MEVLTTPSSVRQAVADLLSDYSDERIVVVAFVGADALSFVPVAKGLSVYCWPKPGGTNPAGIDALLDAGAKVEFVERLHAKIYWSRNRGSLIGSANLTANALGDTGLREAVVLLPPSAFDVRPLVQSLAVVNDFEGTLKRLRVAHIKFLQKNPHLSPRPARLRSVDSFEDWYSRAGRAEWRIGWYEEDEEPPSDAVDNLEESTGSAAFATFLGVRKEADLKAGLVTLGFRVREDSHGNVKVSQLHWWAPEIKVRSRDVQWKEFPILWFARRFLPKGERGPFNCEDPKFRRALAVAIEGTGGLDRLKRRDLQPSSLFVARLVQEYRNTVASKNAV